MAKIFFDDEQDNDDTYREQVGFGFDLSFVADLHRESEGTLQRESEDDSECVDTDCDFIMLDLKGDGTDFDIDRGYEDVISNDSSDYSDSDEYVPNVDCESSCSDSYDDFDSEGRIYIMMGKRVRNQATHFVKGRCSTISDSVNLMNVSIAESRQLLNIH